MQHLTLQAESRYQLFQPQEGKSNSNADDSLLVSTDKAIQANNNNYNKYKSISDHDDSDVFVSLCTLGNNNGNDNDHQVRFLMSRHGRLVRWNNETLKVEWECNLNETCSFNDSNQERRPYWFYLSNRVDNLTTLVCISRLGAIVTVDADTGTSTLIGEFEHGLEAACWSADGEILWLLTFGEKMYTDHPSNSSSENNTDNNDGNDSEIQQHQQQNYHQDSMLLAMNCEWQVLAETVHASHIKSYLCKNLDDDDDQYAVSMASKADSSVLAISSVDYSDQQRKIRFYQRDTLQLLAIGRSEDGSGKLVPNLCSTTPLAWAGLACSQILATTQRRSKKTLAVVFFEPNGLKHGEFLLRESQPDKCSVTLLSWNLASDLLVVCVRDSTNGSSNCIYKVQLWHRCNYYWYLKYEFFYRNCSVTQLIFDENDSYRLFVLLSDDTWCEYQLRWHTSYIAPTVYKDAQTDESSKSNEECMALVVDGCQLQVTPLHRAIIPPPMFGSAVIFNAPITSVAMVKSAISKTVASGMTLAGIVTLSDGSIVALNRSKQTDLNGNDKSMAPTLTIYEISGFVTLTRDSNDVDVASLLPLREVLLLHSEQYSIRLLAVTRVDATNSTSETLLDIQLTKSKDDANWVGNILSMTTTEEKVLCMTAWSDSSCGALLQLLDGSFLEYELDSQTLIPSAIEPLLEPCPWMVAIKNTSNLAGAMQTYRKSLVVGVSFRRRLYCHDLLLCDSATSFQLSLTHQYLCYASAGSGSQLRFLPLCDLAAFDPLAGSDENALLVGYEPRNCERGARIVSVLPNSPTVVLQMPRGNLESASPQALVLRHVMIKIEKTCQYKEAFDIMRRQKVDLNLFVDLSPHHFLYQGGLDAFLQSVTNVDYLNLFISCLQNWDCTTTRYSIPTWLRRTLFDAHTEKNKFDFSTKVNVVCNSMRQKLLEMELDRESSIDGSSKKEGLVLPILSTYAKETPPRLEDALLLIKKKALKEKNIKQRGPPLFSEKAQASIQYLAFLADYELLFDTALGMYDFEVARAVARNSQMDPKVYLPLLKYFQELPTYYGKYEVDVRVHRYESALRNLFQSFETKETQKSENKHEILKNTLDDCIAFITQHKLYNTALELFRSDNERQQIVILYGDHLMDSGLYNEALSVFLMCNPIEIDKAKKAAKMCHDWRALFGICEQQGGNGAIPELRSMLAREVADQLSGSAVNKFDKRTALLEASRILLDYGNDVPGSIETLLQAEMWSEGHRISTLHHRVDLIKKCVDAAVNYAHICIDDLNERLEQFCTANNRYYEVLNIRKNALEADPSNINNLPDNADEGSLFSVASNASAASVRSHSSTGSLSSVISVKSTASTTFGLTGADEVYKHKSKFNRIGRDRKKNKKKQGKGRTKIIPGSEQELKGLVETMKSVCIDKLYADVITETITYLCRVDKGNDAKELYVQATATIDGIKSSQVQRIEKTRLENLEAEQLRIKEGTHIFNDVKSNYESLEKEVDTLECFNLSSALSTVLMILP